MFSDAQEKNTYSTRLGEKRGLQCGHENGYIMQLIADNCESWLDKGVGYNIYRERITSIDYLLHCQ